MLGSDKDQQLLSKLGVDVTGYWFYSVSEILSFQLRFTT